MLAIASRSDNNERCPLKYASGMSLQKPWKRLALHRARSTSGLKRWPKENLIRCQPALLKLPTASPLSRINRVQREVTKQIKVTFRGHFLYQQFKKTFNPTVFINKSHSSLKICSFCLTGLGVLLGGFVDRARREASRR